MNAHSLPISVVIATRNRPVLLAETIQSICSGAENPAEIIVVDQSDLPQPPSVPNAGGCDVRHLPSRSRGLSRGRNVGVAAARSPLVVFTDDDMRADRVWLGTLARELVREGPSTAVTGRVIAGAAETSNAFVPSTVSRPHRATFSGRLRIDALAGGNMAMYRDAFLAAGGFDSRLGAGTRFPAAEDNDLGYRLLEAGFTIVYLPDAVLTHRAWRSSEEYLTMRFAYGRGKGAFYLKHAYATDLHMIRRMTRDVLRRGGRAVRRMLHPRMAAGELVYAAGVLRGAAEWEFRRHQATDNHLFHDEIIESLHR